MRPIKSKQTKPSVKLPSIGNKTIADIQTQTLKQKQRPLSSKNIVTDLEKKLFSQLDAYQQKTSTLKNTRKSMNKVNKKQSNIIESKQQTNKFLMSNSCKDINSSNSINNGDAMQKLAKCIFLIIYNILVMPQLYSKIISNKNYEEDNEPLKESHINKNNQSQSNILITQIKSELSKTTNSYNKNTSRPVEQKNIQKQNSILKNSLNTMPANKSVSLSRSSTIKQKQKQKISKQTKQIQAPQTMDSFIFAQNQVNKIYQQYLLQQGLSQDQYNFTSMNQLNSMNKDLQKCQVDIKQLEQNYQKLISQLGGICLNDLEEKANMYQ